MSSFCYEQTYTSKLVVFEKLNTTFIGIINRIGKFTRRRVDQLFFREFVLKSIIIYVISLQRSNLCSVSYLSLRSWTLITYSNDKIEKFTRCGADQPDFREIHLLTKYTYLYSLKGNKLIRYASND